MTSVAMKSKQQAKEDRPDEVCFIWKGPHDLLSELGMSYKDAHTLLRSAKDTKHDQALFVDEVKRITDPLEVRKNMVILKGITVVESADAMKMHKDIYQNGNCRVLVEKLRVLRKKAFELPQRPKREESLFREIEQNSSVDAPKLHLGLSVVFDINGLKTRNIIEQVKDGKALKDLYAVKKEALGARPAQPDTREFKHIRPDVESLRSNPSQEALDFTALFFAYKKSQRATQTDETEKGRAHRAFSQHSFAHGVQVGLDLIGKKTKPEQVLE